MVPFSDLLDKYNARVLAIVGLAKNSGKTNTLNHVISRFAGRGMTYGLTSTGRDGELFDALTSKIKKPSIHVSKGTYIATASQLFNKLTADATVLQDTGFRTQMGNVLICRVNNPCTVQLAGPITNKGVKEVSNRMLALGCKYVVIDGSIDRFSVASSNISDAIIITSGASVHEEMYRVIAKTKEFVDRFSLVEIDGDIKKLIIDEILPTNRIALIYEGKNYELINSIIGVIDKDRIVRHINKHTKYVFMPGAFFEDDAKYSIERSSNAVFIVEDGSKTFFDVDRYKNLGLQLMTLHKTKILAITINPDYPTYYSFDKSLFLNAMRGSLDSIPVLDLGKYSASVLSHL